VPSVLDFFGKHCTHRKQPWSIWRSRPATRWTTIEPDRRRQAGWQPRCTCHPDTDGGMLDGDTTWDRAVGPFQFIPSTWARWKADGNADGVADPQNIEDAALAAGRYLCAGGTNLADGTGWWRTILSYDNPPSTCRTCSTARTVTRARRYIAAAAHRPLPLLVIPASTSPECPECTERLRQSRMESRPTRLPPRRKSLPDRSIVVALSLLTRVRPSPGAAARLPHVCWLAATTMCFSAFMR